VIGAAANGRRAVSLTRERQPDVAVLKASLPIVSGLSAARQMLRSAPRMGVVLVTGFGDERVAHEALRVGVRGLVLQAQGLGDLIDAVRDVSHGGIYISPCYSHGVLEAFGQRNGGHATDLTRRESEVLALIAGGKTTKQAAAELHISVRTAECHRAHLMKKLGVHDAAGLVRYAIREGLIVA
jgi:DNA-binding NarL/FixJ family response regulator